jgi:hypothetical protein
MSFFNTQFQAVSDLHLETPLASPQYKGSFKLEIRANNLLLLGDIGLAKDDGLYEWLESLLKSTPNLRIFYIFGNHEYYQLSPPAARGRMEAFAKKVDSVYGDRFIFMHRRRYDLGNVTILGCTLWSNVSSSDAPEVQARLTDFNETRGIREWDIQTHNEEHLKDLAWLNSQVRQLEYEPGRQILIVTHHSPTLDPRANDPLHDTSPVKAGFVTDLSKEICWMSPAVKMWAFGHTHYNCDFHDSLGKLVMANQKGYAGLGATVPSLLEIKVVEVDRKCWEIVDIKRAQKTTKRRNTNAKTPPKELKNSQKSIFSRAANRIPALLTRRPRPFE